MTDAPPARRGPGDRRVDDSAREDLARAYDAHAASLFRYALMILADRSAAQDALQQAFAGLASQLAHGRTPSAEPRCGGRLQPAFGGGTGLQACE